MSSGLAVARPPMPALKTKYNTKPKAAPTWKRSDGKQGHFLPDPQEGPQKQFVESEADITIYGGSAGGGKSAGLLLSAAKHSDNAHYGAVIFRETYAQVTEEGSLWDTSRELFGESGAVATEGNLEWDFPSGAKVSFAYLQHEKDKYKYQGSQMAFIGFDELTHFSEANFWYMLSRNRTTCGVQPQIKCTCNPDAESWVAKLISWWIDSDGYIIPERSGKLRWFLRLGGEDFVWADSKQELIDKGAEEELIYSLTFIRSRLIDNKILVEKDPRYRARLSLLPQVERERLLGDMQKGGNWKISTSGGLVQRSWFKTFNLEGKPATPDRIIQSWDTANKESELADYSVCTTWYVTKTGYYLVDLWREKVGSPELIRTAINLAAKWKPHIILVEDKASGTGLIQHLKEKTSLTVFPIIPVAAKMIRFSNESPAIEGGKVFVPYEAPWVTDYTQELVVAPNGLHDDQCDSTSQFLAYVREHGGKTAMDYL
jgi:predicted phage terminase large subunit-like protein